MITLPKGAEQAAGDLLGTCTGTIIGGVTSSGLISFVIILGVVAALMTAIGLLLGRWLSYQAGKWAEIVGGLVLTGIGIKMFF